MKRTRLTILSACLLLFAATFASAAPPAGWDPFTPPGVTGSMWTLGSITLNGSPLPVDNASLIAVFVSGVTSPVGVFKMSSADTTDGAYGFLTVYGHGSFDPPPPKIGAVTGDLLNIKLYLAATDSVLDVFTVQNYGDLSSPLGSPIDNVTYSEFAADNVTLNFRYDFPPVIDNAPSSGSINEGEVAPFTVHAVDPNGDTIAYSATGLPGFCTLGPGTGSGLCTPSFSNAGVYDNICFTAASTGFSGTPKFSAPVCVTLTVLNVNRPPTWTVGGDNAATMTTYAGQGTPFLRTYAASDLDNQALTWTLQNNPAYCSLTGSGNSRTLSCTPTLADQGTTASNVKVTVSDGIDNTVDTFNVTVGNRKPVIDPIATQSVSYLKSGPTVIPVVLSDPDGNGVSFTAALPSLKSWFAYDNAARTITVTGPVPIGDAGAYTVQVTATDNAGIPLTDNKLFTLNIALQIAWDAVPTSKTMNEGGDNTFIFHATDPLAPGTERHFRSGPPAFCAYNGVTGALRCQPGYADNGVYSMTLRALAVDGVTYALPDNVVITLTVLNVNRPPTWTVGGDNAATMTTYPGQGTPFTRTYAASDLDNEVLTWTLQNAPSYCSLTGSGTSRTLSCTPTLANQGTTASNVRVTVSDGIDNTVDTFNVTVGNRKPLITPIVTQNVSYAKTSPTVIPVVLSDPDGNGVSFTAAMSPSKSWFGYDNAARTITVTGPVPITDNGAYTVTINATDNASSPLTDNTSFTLNIALQIAWDAVPTSKTMNEGGDNTFIFHATDPLVPGMETHILSGKPAFCGTFNATTGALRCQPGYADNGVYTMTLRARAIDNVTYALPDTVSITLTVLNVNRPPTWTVGGDNAATMTTYAGQGTPFLRTYAASDLDNQALTWTLQNNPSYCSLTGSGNSRTLSCTPTLANQGTTASNVRVTVSDGIDNTVDTFNVTVGNRKPVITPIATQNVSYLRSAPTVIPVVLSDPDGNGVSFTAAMSPSKSWFGYDNAARTITVTGPVPITDNGAYTVTINATDNAGIPLTDNTSFTLNITLQITWDAIPTSKTMNEGGDNTFIFHATDPLHPGQETILFLGRPAFCVDNATTGALRCQPGFADNGVYTMTLRARAVDGVTYAIPDNVSITLTVNNVNRSPVLTPTPAGALSGNIGATISKSYVASDPDSDPLTWTTFNVPSFCQVTPSTGNTRTFSCTPTVAAEGTYDNVVVRVSDGTAQAEESFSVTVNNRAPSISAIADLEVVYTATSATTVPITVSDPDGNGVTMSATISPTPSGSWFSFSGNVITIGTGIPRADAGSYTVTVSAIDNGTPARSAADVSFKLGVSYPRHYAVPVAQAASMFLGVSGLTLSGTPASLFDEVAAFSVHRVPGSLPTKWESKLVGWGRVDNTAGVLPAMAVYGDNPSTASVREGMGNGEEILLVLWHNDPAGSGSEYYAFDNGAGAPVSVTWDNAVASKSFDAVNFIPGNRYPLRNGAWNLIGHGIGTGYHTGATPSNSQLPGISWNTVANLLDAFPLKSIEGKIDRIISNDGSGNKVFLPGVGGTMTYFAPGYGYYIRMKAASAELSWITVPGSPVSASASLAVGQGYSLLGVWDESHVYSQNGYDPTGELRSLRAFVDTGVGFDTTLSSIGQVWPSGTDYDRIIMYDATGARFFLQALPPQFNTMRYVAPGYGFWINVTNPSGMTVNFPPARD